MTIGTVLAMGLATLYASVALRAVPQTSQEPRVGSCITCHQAFPDERLGGPVRQFEGDIHKARGFGCVICHGGDASDPGMGAMDPAKGFIGVPGPPQVAQVCGRCHADGQFMRQYDPALRVDQVAEYAVSRHGQRLMEAGDTAVATCASCHTPHAILPPSDPRSSVHPLRVAALCGSCHADSSHMAPYGIATDQLAKYERSIHWEMLSEGDLSAPTCNDCHGNHGAAPLGVSWVGNVCGQCHSVMAGYYAQSRHSQLFALMGNPGCATCHGNHDVEAASDTLLGLGEGAICSRCHVEGAGGGVGAARMRALIDTLRNAFHIADSLLSKAERSGAEVSQAQFELQGAQTSLVQARAAVHAFNVDVVEGEVAPGLEITTAALERAENVLKELSFRRFGLATSVVIILLLIAGLFLRIWHLERRHPAGSG